MTGGDVCRWLYWNDQRSARIERSKLDGTQRQVLVRHNVTWPNQMALVHHLNYT